MPVSRSPDTLARALLVDADDTLWEGSIFYVQCAQRFQDYMTALGCDPDAALRDLRSAEIAAIPTLGYGPHGFMQALETTCRQLLTNAGRIASPEAVAGARAIGEPLLDVPIVLLPHVEATLRALHPSTWLVLVTKGAYDVQRRKLGRSGLAGLFDAVYIEPEKNAALYRHIVSEQALDPARTWMVGNSPRSDVNESIRAGLHAIYVPHAATWVGELADIESPDQVVTLARFADLLAYFHTAQPTKG